MQGQFRKNFHLRDAGRGPAQVRGTRDARGGSGPRTVRAPADLARGTRPVPPLRLRTMPVYYDKSGMFDHARLFA